MIRTWLAQQLANFQLADPFDACVLVVAAIALALILGAAAWSWWVRSVEGYDPDWYTEGHPRW